MRPLSAIRMKGRVRQSINRNRARCPGSSSGIYMLAYRAGGAIGVDRRCRRLFSGSQGGMLNARHSILLLGWDFDTRIKFEPEAPTLPGPNRLGRFVRWLTEQRPELQICILKWDLGLLMALARGATPLFIFDWMLSRRIRCKLDGHHPPGATHHQKVGSSNLNNRLRGLDSECDLVIEAEAQPSEIARERVRRTVESIRDDLMAEQLGVPSGEVATAIEEAGGSPGRAIARLRRYGRTLHPLTVSGNGILSEVFAENALHDPESTESIWRTFWRRLWAQQSQQALR